jgi:uncharacterized protein (DUF2141 family)
LKHKAITGLKLLAGILLAVALARCAHQGSLTGGPKDEVPPSLVEAEPPLHTTRFQADRVTVTFNEFIQLKDPGKEIFMSPPMKEKPEYKVHGRDLVIQFKEPFKENSTYTINFGNSVADFTEGNVLANFEYVFSTGDVIDSLYLEGKVVNAFDLKAEPDILALIYSDDHDSLPLDSLPLNVPPKSASRTDKEGKFRLNNLPPGKYKLVALQDLNSNFYYDLPNERFAFLDSLVTLHVPTVPDTTQTEEPDSSLMPDYGASIAEKELYELYMFELADQSQKLLGKKRIGKNRLQYTFKVPVDTLAVSLVDYVPERTDWYIPEFSKLNDTVDLWLRPGLPDTIRVRIFAGDSIADTSRFVLALPERTGAKPKKDEVRHAKFTSSIKAGSLDLYKQLNLVFTSPLQSLDSTLVLLKPGKDSVFISPPLSFTDSIHRSVQIHHAWIPGESYMITFNDSAFTDQEGLVNDSTTLNFKVRTAEDYGILIMQVEVTEGTGPYMILLLDQGDALLAEKVVNKSAQVTFDYLLPGKYKLKAIHDVNGNGRWSPGNYRSNLLPEGVQYYPGDVSIRANWELQEDWKLLAR